MQVTDWAEAQKEDPKFSTVLDWLKAQKKTDLKALLTEHASSKEGQLMLKNWQNFIIHQGPCTCTQHTKVRPKIFYSLWSLGTIMSLPLNGCHRDVGQQGHDRSLSLLQECFWWPGMANQMQQSIKSCAHCLQHEGDLSKAPLYSIVATAPMDLLHVDFTSTEMTLELNRHLSSPMSWYSRIISQST